MNLYFTDRFFDASLLRNHLAHWLYRQTGRYSPRTRLAVLYIQQGHVASPEYHGIYLWMEKIGFGKNRLNLAELNASCDQKHQEWSGGWAWEWNSLSFESFSPNLIMDPPLQLYTNAQRPVLLYPNGEKLTQEMRNYFVDPTTSPFVQMYHYLYYNLTNPEAIDQYLDIGSYVDYFLHTEMSMNQDAYRRSMYSFKDRHEPINAGPVWDLNLAYGIGRTNLMKDGTEGWLYGNYLFWKRLTCHYQFAALVVSRWRQLRATVWSDASIASFLRNEAAPIQRQLETCHLFWKRSTPPCAFVAYTNALDTYEATLEQLLIALKKRCHWMDQILSTSYFFYRSLSVNFCGDGGPLPQFNCGPNGNDSKCLETPEIYIQNVSFPAIRKGYNGTACKSKRERKGSHTDQGTIDYCWLATGSGMLTPGLTSFCSGFGNCPQGPNATCQCLGGRKGPSCAAITKQSPTQEYKLTTLRLTSVTETTKQADNTLADDRHFQSLLLAFVMFLGGVFVGSFLSNCLRKKKKQAKQIKENRERQLNQLKSEAQISEAQVTENKVKQRNHDEEAHLLEEDILRNYKSASRDERSTTDWSK